MQAISSKQLKKGIIKLSGTEISIKTTVKPDRICQVRVVPKCNCYVIEVIYNEQEPAGDRENSASVASIDLGLNNLVALTSNQPGFIPLLINGRPLKSINQFYNKRKSQLQSQLKGNLKTSSRIVRLTRWINQKVDNYLYHFHKIVLQLVGIVCVSQFPNIRKKNVSRGFGLTFGKQQKS